MFTYFITLQYFTKFSEKYGEKTTIAIGLAVNLLAVLLIGPFGG
jgi:hypothetical protein